jgi:transposase
MPLQATASAPSLLFSLLHYATRHRVTLQYLPQQRVEVQPLHQWPFTREVGMLWEQKDSRDARQNSNRAAEKGIEEGVG